MDRNAFDELSKRLSTVRMTRTSALRGLVGGAVALVGGAVALESTEAKKKRKSHKKGRGRVSKQVGAYANKVVYSGQGLNCTDTCDLKATQICGVENGADVDGPYLLWVLTATGATAGDITINGTTYPMIKTSNGAFKYVSGPLDLNTLDVYATYNGKAKNAQLVISHGCLPNETCQYSCTLGYYGAKTCGNPAYWNNCGQDPSRSQPQICFGGFTSNGLAPDTVFPCNTSMTYAQALGCKGSDPICGTLQSQQAAALLNLLGLGCYPLTADDICAATNPDDLKQFNEHGGDTGRICPLIGNCTNNCGDTCPAYTN